MQAHTHTHTHTHSRAYQQHITALTYFLVCVRLVRSCFSPKFVKHELLRVLDCRTDDKLRLLAVYSITQRVEVPARMHDVANLSMEQKFVLDNLEFLGVTRSSVSFS